MADIKCAFDIIAKALENAESDSDEEEEDDEYCEVEEVLSTDEDEIDEEGAEYLETLERKIKSSQNACPFPMTAQIADVSNSVYQSLG